MTGDRAAQDRLDLDKIAARAEAATEGPWVSQTGRYDDLHWGDCGAAAGVDLSSTKSFFVPGFRREDAEFIAAARTDIPQLVAELRLARHRLDEVQRLCDAAGADETNLVRGGSSWPLLDAADVRAALSSVPGPQEPA